MGNRRRRPKSQGRHTTHGRYHDQNGKKAQGTGHPNHDWSRQKVNTSSAQVRAVQVNNNQVVSLTATLMGQQTTCPACLVPRALQGLAVGGLDHTLGLRRCLETVCVRLARPLGWWDLGSNRLATVESACQKTGSKTEMEGSPLPGILQTQIRSVVFFRRSKKTPGQKNLQ